MSKLGNPVFKPCLFTMFCQLLTWPVSLTYLTVELDRWWDLSDVLVNSDVLVMNKNLCVCVSRVYCAGQSGASNFKILKKNEISIFLKTFKKFKNNKKSKNCHRIHLHLMRKLLATHVTKTDGHISEVKLGKTDQEKGRIYCISQSEALNFRNFQIFLNSKFQKL